MNPVLSRQTYKIRRQPFADNQHEKNLAYSQVEHQQRIEKLAPGKRGAADHHIAAKAASRRGEFRQGGVNLATPDLRKITVVAGDGALGEEDDVDASLRAAADRVDNPCDVLVDLRPKDHLFRGDGEEFFQG
jgi:hypothetical protein